MSKKNTILIMLLLAACGKAPDDKANDLRQEELISDGVYATILTPLNGKVSTNVNGEVRISKYGDDFRVSVLLQDAPAGIHPQHLYDGTSCPQLDTDINIDGYIDTDEARRHLGMIVLPFDGDLSSQLAGNHLYPNGNYHYKNSTSYQLMLSDLHQTDDVINDEFIKIRGDLALEKRVVVVYGKGRNLPVTVSHPNLPIACGILTKISDSPDDYEDSWDNPPSPRPRRERPRRRVPHEKPPDVTVEPKPPENTGWWDHWRERLRRWRERVRDWWSGDRPQ